MKPPHASARVVRLSQPACSRKAAADSVQRRKILSRNVDRRDGLRLRWAQTLSIVGQNKQSRPGIADKELVNEFRFQPAHHRNIVTANFETSSRSIPQPARSVDARHASECLVRPVDSPRQLAP